MMLKSPGNAAWMRDGSMRSGRRGWASAAWLIAGTLAVALTSYSLSLKVSGERRETDRLARQNSALEAELRALDAELRVRMRLPQLQHWNDDILGMVPISATQYLSDPLYLANYGKPLPGDAPALPGVQLAIRDVPFVPPAARPMLVPVRAESVAAGPAAQPGPVAFGVDRSPLSPSVPTGPGHIVSNQSAPDDLLRQVEMTFQGRPGNQ